MLEKKYVALSIQTVQTHKDQQKDLFYQPNQLFMIYKFDAASA